MKYKNKKIKSGVLRIDSIDKLIKILKIPKIQYEIFDKKSVEIYSDISIHVNDFDTIIISNIDCIKVKNIKLIGNVVCDAVLIADELKVKSFNSSVFEKLIIKKLNTTSIIMCKNFFIYDNYDFVYDRNGKIIFDFFHNFNGSKDKK